MKVFEELAKAARLVVNQRWEYVSTMSDIKGLIEFNASKYSKGLESRLDRGDFVQEGWGLLWTKCFKMDPFANLTWFKNNFRVSLPDQCITLIRSQLRERNSFRKELRDNCFVNEDGETSDIFDRLETYEDSPETSMIVKDLLQKLEKRILARESPRLTRVFLTHFFPGKKVASLEIPYMESKSWESLQRLPLEIYAEAAGLSINLYKQNLTEVRKMLLELLYEEPRVIDHNEFWTQVSIAIKLGKLEGPL